MAEHDAPPTMDYAEHTRTYERFLSLAKYTTVSVVVVLILMALFLL